jgi:hypothetical protein
MANPIVIVDPIRYTGHGYISVIKRRVKHDKLIVIWTSEDTKELASSLNHLAEEEYICNSFEDAISLLGDRIPRCVLVGSDNGFALADRLQMHYYPDNSNELTSYQYRVDKFSYFNYLKDLGLIQTSQQLVTNEDLHKFDPTKKYVVKPIDGQGNDYTFITDNVAQLDLSEFQRKFMIQDYIDGPEYCIEVCTRNGNHKCTMASIYKGDHLVDLNPWREENELISHQDPVVQVLFDYIKPILTTLGVKVGVTWSQIKLDNGVPHLIEVNFRSQGHGLIDLIQNSTTINYVSETLRSYLNIQQPVYDGIVYQKIGEFNKISINNKKEKYMDGLPVEELKDIPSIKFISVSEKLFPGIVPVSRSVRTTMGSIIVQNNNLDQYLEDMEKINQWKNKVAN